MVAGSSSPRQLLFCFWFEFEFQGFGAVGGDFGGERADCGVAVGFGEDFAEAAGVFGAGGGIGDEIFAVGFYELVDDDLILA